LLAWFFVFFVISGFCSILYELVWLRLSMAEFGVNTALVSIVLSAFMGGLGLGSWFCGVLLRNNEMRLHFPILRLYALTELLIGISAICVPYEFHLGRALLEAAGVSSSGTYYLASGFWLAITLVPWCALMGATIPIAMEAIRRSHPKEENRSFSFLYLANVGGAVLGTFVPLWLIEAFGFRGTLIAGAVLNGFLALAATAVSWRASSSTVLSPLRGVPVKVTYQERRPSVAVLLLLFATGLSSMGMEIAWIRQFTPYVGTVVYAFATILAVYLGATFIGSQIYRYWSARKDTEPILIWILLGISAVLSPAVANPNIHLPGLTRVILGIAPFTGLLGFIAPMLIERWSGGDPARAGHAYAVNVLGCILGPLVSGFLLLPYTSERWVIFILAFPWLLFAGRPAGSYKSAPTPPLRLASHALLPLALLLIFSSKGYERQRAFPESLVLRDHTATVIARGQGFNKQLLVNGVGITIVSPITKMMAHIPLAMLGRPPQNALAICFGMGTTYRSLMSWGIPVTAVELVPSVPRLFWFFHSDAEQLLSSPRSTIVIDDGRRYLERTPQQFDVVVIDPPPPVDAAASSLLYSKEFYSIAKRRLRSDGILQQWIPNGDSVDIASVARSFKESFPYVRVYRSVAGWGYHLIGSLCPIPNASPAELTSRMPNKAVSDLMEWGPKPDAISQFAAVLNTERPIDRLLDEAPGVVALSDDRPTNEYYILRRRLLPKKWRYLLWRDRRHETVLANDTAEPSTQ
jgi:spermidine synthase